jgi:DNA-binding LacI/PurR family transcriptional regulator
LDEIDVITTDHFYGGKIAAEYLLSLGHRKILYVTKDSNEQEYKSRLEGYKFALAEAGIEINENDIIKTKFSVKSIREFVSKNIELIKTKTAIFALNDLTAINIINELNRYGIKVPEDISIIEYDDVEGLEHFGPELTTIHQPRETISKLGCERLIELLKDNSGKEKLNLQVRPSLVIRNSCKKI